MGLLQTKELQELLSAKIDGFVEGLPENFREMALDLFSKEAKGLRPKTVLAVACALEKRLPLDAALSLELFHIASCLLDDLPCMDDALTRHGARAFHKKHGEAKAILMATGLISEGYALVVKEIESFSKELPADRERAASIALKKLTHDGGLSGIILGQYHDLFEGELSAIEIAAKKTALFFETAFLFGFVFGGGDLTFANQVQKVGRSLGMLLQLIDDFLDLKEDLAQGGKITNLVAVLGEKRALEEIEKELSLFELGVIECGLFGAPLRELLEPLFKPLHSQPALSHLLVGR